MFICAFDGKTYGPRIHANKVVVEVRNKKYQYQKRKKILLEEEDTYSHVNSSKDNFEFHTATGWEIVKEVTACDNCAKKHGHKHYDSMI